MSVPGPGDLPAPRAILFDWHATLVDTRDAMYLAVDEVIPRLQEEGLIGRLVRREDCKTPEDARLVDYVRQHQVMHPKIRRDQKISRTDIFELLFGDDEDAKSRAHAIFDAAYGNLFGAVEPMEPGIAQLFDALHARGIQVGILSNRKRDFMAHELWAVEGGAWIERVDAMVCGDDVPRRKPAPDLVQAAAKSLDLRPRSDCWYIGDSTTDIIAGKRAGVTAIFYNGAGWSADWISRIFPGSRRHPDQPDAVLARLGDLFAWTSAR